MLDEVEVTQIQVIQIQEEKNLQEGENLQEEIILIQLLNVMNNIHAQKLSYLVGCAKK